MNDGLQIWDVFYAFVPYDEGVGGKIRPIVIIKDGSQSFALALYLTTKPPKNNDDISINDLLAAGLPQMTYTRVKRRFSLNSIKIHDKRGRLSNADQARVGLALRRYDQKHS